MLVDRRMTLKIKELFDTSKDIYRTIEKVITYNVAKESRLKSEITEYVVTDHIEEQIHKVLDKMNDGMESGGGYEVGIWVSGFYGSGKSSFTKYLGLAFDNQAKIDHTPFLTYFINQIKGPKPKALLSAIVRKYPAAVVMLDLASEMLAGAKMEDIATVLYYKVLQWAGYSRNLKVAALEIRLEQEGRFEEFQKRLLQDFPDMKYSDLQNDPLIIDGLVPQIAYEMYPTLFPTPSSFTTNTQEFVKSLEQQAIEMIDIIRKKSNKEYIIFIIDEVGQYIGARGELILSLDGFSKIIKDKGNGKVWILATAQQTLTEDSERAHFNSKELFKLKDRFPIQIELDSKDIKEICYRRLLGKSVEGESIIGKLFETYGQSFKQNTRLVDVKLFDVELNQERFVQLYPFLPVHFDILLSFLTALSKTTGGIGLRSAIKVIQDILVEPQDSESAGERDVGWICNVETLFLTLEKDIQKSFQSIYQAVTKTILFYSNSKLHCSIARTIAVLQIIKSIPIYSSNVASLIPSSISELSNLDEVSKIIEGMVNESKVPLSEKEGELGFLSEKLNSIEEERGNFYPPNRDYDLILVEGIRSAFQPVPSIKLHNSFAVKTGVKLLIGSKLYGISDERETIQTIIELVEPEIYEASKVTKQEESRDKEKQNSILLIAQNLDDIKKQIIEIYKCNRINEKYKNDLNQEVKDYCTNQKERSAKLSKELSNRLRKHLCSGSFIFRGQILSIGALHQDLIESAKKQLLDVAKIVFDKNSIASERVESSLAENFLKKGNLSAINAQIDPLKLVIIKNSQSVIDTKHSAILCIRDLIERNGIVDGKKLLEVFTDAPFGWSQDTIRYIVSAMLLAGEIKLRVSGKDILVNGQHAIEVLKTNKAFQSVGISLREGKPSVDVLARASNRLTELTGEMVIPLEDKICKMGVKYLPSLQNKLAPLSEKLNSLRTGGIEISQQMNTEIAEVLSTDASDLPTRIGKEESIFFQNIKWAKTVFKELENGLEKTIYELQSHKEGISNLPEIGILGDLKTNLQETLSLVSQRLKSNEFYKHRIDFQSSLTEIKSQIQKAIYQINQNQLEFFKLLESEIHSLVEWKDIPYSEKSILLDRLESYKKVYTEDLNGLKEYISNQYIVNSIVMQIKDEIRKRALEIRKNDSTIQTKSTFKIPRKLKKKESIERVINGLTEIKNTWTESLEIELEFEDENGI